MCLRSKIQRLVRAVCLGALGIYALLPGAARGEFISRGQPSLTYVSDNGRVAVIITHNEREGVFIAYSPDGTVQGFDPRRLPARTTRSAFFAFDRERNTFTQLILPSGLSFNIQGNFNLRLGDATVSLDRQGASYLTVVSDSGKNASVLGLSNQQPIVNTGGPAVAILKANALLDEKYHEILKEFVAEENGKLSLGGVPFEGAQIGVSVEAENPCLRSNAVILPLGEYKRLEKTGSLMNAGSISEDARKKALPFSQFQSLNITPTFIAAIDLEAGAIGVIRQRPSELGICVFTPIAATE